MLKYIVLPMRGSISLLIALLLIAILPIAILLLPCSASAQTPVWTQAIRADCECVAFNPLSHGRILFAASKDSAGVFRSENGGSTWTRYSAGLFSSTSSNFRQLLCLDRDTNVVLGITPSLVYRSTDGGHSWEESLNPGGIEGEDMAYQSATDVLYYGQNFKGPIWKSTDRGGSWTKSGQADTSVTLCTLAVSSGLPVTLLAGSETGVIVRSVAEGANWNVALPADGVSWQIEVPKIVFAQHHAGSVLATRWLSETKSLVLSTDDGNTWSPIHSPSPSVWALEIDQRDAPGPSPRHFWVGLFRDRPDTVSRGMVQETQDGGMTWRSTNFPPNVEAQDVWMLKFDTTSGLLAAATSGGLYIASLPLAVKQGEESDSPRLSYDPVRQRLHVTGELTRSVEVCDMLGRVLLRTSLTDLDLHSLPTGAYIGRMVGIESRSILVVK